jgi:hypothetical protein
LATFLFLVRRNVWVEFLKFPVVFHDGGLTAEQRIIFVHHPQAAVFSACGCCFGSKNQHQFSRLVVVAFRTTTPFSQDWVPAGQAAFGPSQ